VLAAGVRPVPLAVGALREGIYLVRVTQAGRNTTARLAIIR